jgi:hypothetical protein
MCVMTAATVRSRSSVRVSWKVAVSIVLAAGGLVAAGAGAGPARAAAAGKCSGKTGINVVVDSTKLKGGKVQIGCDKKKPASGLAALKRAGFSYTFVPRHPGFICTIDRRPNKCNGAPTTAYWSYWHAKPHGKWMYSKLGAGSYHPKAGTVEGWAFGNGKAPKIPPP